MPFFISMAGGLVKCLSLGSAAALRIERHPHDYCYHGNPEFVRAMGASWVKLWVSWYDLQAAYRPASREESWWHLNEAPGDIPDSPPFSTEPALRSLDRQIAAAKADGLKVILAVDECSPEWAVDESGTVKTGLERFASRIHGSRPPLNCSTQGPWAWFFEHLCRRYSGGAQVDAIEICCEPNLRWPWDEAPAAVAEMIRSAAEISARCGGPAVLAPSLADLDEDALVGPWGAGMPLRLFAERLLRDLEGFTPRVYVGWSQHNYGDIAAGSADGVHTVLPLLRRRDWADSSAAVWLTEGACHLDDPRMLTVTDALEDESLQAQLLELNFHACAAVPQVRLWTHQSIHDYEMTRIKTGLLGDFDFLNQLPGAEKLAYDRFCSLPGLVDDQLATLDGSRSVA
jgi:hypothetical protein